MQNRSSAFTLIELLVVIAIIATLAAVLLPVMGRVQDEARSNKCLSQLRQLGMAARLFANDHDMSLPVTVHQRRAGGKSWTLSLQEYAGGKIIFRCPCDEDKARQFTYVINDFLTPNPAGAADLDFSKISRLERPAETFLFAEASKDYANADHFHFADYGGQIIPPEVFAGQVAVKRHGGSAHYVFADAHVETLSWEKAQERLRTPGSRFVDPTAELEN